MAGRMIAEIRTATDPLNVLPAVRAAVESIDRDLPLIEVGTQEQQIGATLSSERIFAKPTSGFGLVALALAAIREAVWLSSAGVLVGLAASLWLARFIGSMLYGLKATGPVTVACVIALLVFVTVAAGLGPARRASRVDPVGALRHE